MKVPGSGPNSNRVTNRDSKTGNIGKKGAEESQGRSKALSDAAGSGGYEKVVLTASKEIAKVKGIIAKTPEVRTKKVEELKSRIDSGDYHVPGSKIAGKMLIDMLGGQGSDQ